MISLLIATLMPLQSRAMSAPILVLNVTGNVKLVKHTDVTTSEAGVDVVAPQWLQPGWSVKVFGEKSAVTLLYKNGKPSEIAPKKWFELADVGDPSDVMVRASRGLTLFGVDRAPETLAGLRPFTETFVFSDTFTPRWPASATVKNVTLKGTTFSENTRGAPSLDETQLIALRSALARLEMSGTSDGVTMQLLMADGNVVSAPFKLLQQRQCETLRSDLTALRVLRKYEAAYRFLCGRLYMYYRLYDEAERCFLDAENKAPQSIEVESDVCAFYRIMRFDAELKLHSRKLKALQRG